MAPPIPNPYMVSYAPTNRAACKSCSGLMEQYSVRFGRKVRSPWHDGFDVQWMHPGCQRFVDSPEEVTKWQGLRWSDMEEFLSGFDVALDTANPLVAAEMEANEKKWKMADGLLAAGKKVFVPILEGGGIYIPKKSTPLDQAVMAADQIVLGALPPCPVCDNKSLCAYGPVIRCLGFVEGSLHCNYKHTLFDLLKPDAAVTTNEFADEGEPVRGPPLVVPPNILKLPAFKKIAPGLAPKKRERANSEEDYSKCKVSHKRACLGMSFASAGSVSGGVAALRDLVEAHGGTWHAAVSPDTTLLLVPEAKQDGAFSTKKYADAVSYGIPAVTADFVRALCSRKIRVAGQKKRKTSDGDQPQKSAGVILRSRKYMSEYVVGKVKSLSTPVPSLTKLSAETSTKTKPARQDVVRRPAIRPGSALLGVEVEAGDGFEVYVDETGEAFNAPCNMVDLATGINKFYRIAVYVKKKTKEFYFLRKWGRIGQERDHQYRLDCHGTKSHGAVGEFRTKFVELCGFPFEERFEQKPKMGYNRFVELDGYIWDEEKENVKKEESAVKTKARRDVKVESSLGEAVQRLVQLLFSKKMMEAQLRSQNLDMKKMPLGRISERQMTEAYGMLKDLQHLLLENAEKRGSSRWKTLVTAKSNNFYEIVPHSFTLSRTPPAIDTLEMLKQKVEVMESLLQVSVTKSLIDKALQNERLTHPLDAQYETLKTEVSVIDPGHAQFGLLQKMLLNTHGPTHSFWTLHIREAFEISRAGERARFAKFADVPHRRLLWHGSRASNFASILSNGLLIAPPEAPVNGYMFGKGVYFADTVSKSAGYCVHNASDYEGLLLLCEVALGDPYLRVESDSKAAQNCTKAGALHTFAIGRHAPSKEVEVESCCPEKKHSVLALTDGMGRNSSGLALWNAAHDSKIAEDDLCLLYNEFVVYDIAQVLVRYLLRVEFRDPSGSESKSGSDDDSLSSTPLSSDSES